MNNSVSENAPQPARKLNTIDRLQTYLDAGSKNVEIDDVCLKNLLVLARIGFETASGRKTSGEPATGMDVAEAAEILGTYIDSNMGDVNAWVMETSQNIGLNGDTPMRHWLSNIMSAIAKEAPRRGVKL
jgi:hypothetical protein